jgi:hypothetical protein
MIAMFTDKKPPEFDAGNDELRRKKTAAGTI